MSEFRLVVTPAAVTLYRPYPPKAGEVWSYGAVLREGQTPADVINGLLKEMGA